MTIEIWWGGGRGLMELVRGEQYNGNVEDGPGAFFVAHRGKNKTILGAPRPRTYKTPFSG